jgi:hypothetical protein
MNTLLPAEPSTPTDDDLTQALDESTLAPLLTAWDQAHSTASDPEWRHVLEELAHPRTTQAFHQLAGAAA